MIAHILGGLLLASAQVSAPAPPPMAPPAATPDARLAAAVDRVAAEALAAGEAAGFAVAVTERGRTRFARGYGFADLEQRTPVRADTVFRVGSITKEFTAAAVMKLVEARKLSLDDRLAEHLPDFPRGGEVTIRQLLHHTSGIHNYTDLPGFAEAMARDHGAYDMLALIAGAEPLYDFAPGTSWSYSNSGYYLLGLVVEKASRRPFAAYLKSEIIDPLGLAAIRVDDVAEIVPGRAEGYDKAKAPAAGFINAPPISMSVAAAAGAIRSTAGDLARWHEALLGGRVLRPASLRLMLEPGRLSDGRLASATQTAGPNGPPSDFGFGIYTARRDGRRSVGHGGSINGFNANVQTFPDSGVTVALLTNTGGGTAKLMPRLIEAVFEGATPR